MFIGVPYIKTYICMLRESRKICLATYNDSFRTMYIIYAICTYVDYRLFLQSKTINGFTFELDHRH